MSEGFFANAFAEMERELYSAFDAFQAERKLDAVFAEEEAQVEDVPERKLEA